MKLIKKIAAIVVAAAVSVAGLAVAASADTSFAKGTRTLNSGSPERIPYLVETKQQTDFKLPVKTSGTVTVKFIVDSVKGATYGTGTNSMRFELYKSDGSSFKVVSPNNWSEGGKYIPEDFLTDDGIRKSITFSEWYYNYAGSVSWNVSEGTYYLRVVKSSGSGSITLSAIYEQGKASSGSSSSSSSSSDELNTFQISMKKGSSITLSGLTADLKTISKKITWSTSKKSVATVSSSGKVTAKSKGTATITAKCGTKSIKIKIKVV